MVFLANFKATSLKTTGYYQHSILFNKLLYQFSFTQVAESQGTELTNSWQTIFKN